MPYSTSRYACSLVSAIWQQTDQPPLAAVRGLAVRLRFCRQHVPVQRQRVEAGGGGGPDREHAGTMPAGELRAGRRGDRRDRHVEQRIGVGAQMQPRVTQIPAIVLERDRLVAGEELRDDAHPVFQKPAGLALLQADHDAVGRQRARAETEHGTPLSQMVEQHDAFSYPQRIVIGHADDAGAELDVTGSLGGCGDHDFG